MEAATHFVDTAFEMARSGAPNEALAATDMAHLMANLSKTIATTGKVLGHTGLGAAEGAIDSVIAPIKMLAHPMKTAEGLYQAGKFAGNLALGDPAATQKLQTMIHEFSQLSIEQKAEQLSRFAVSLLGPAKLAHAAGFSKGLTTLGNALQKEAAVLREGVKTLAQATKPAQEFSIAGTKITLKVPESVLRECENILVNKPKLEIVKDAGIAKSTTTIEKATEYYKTIGEGLNFTKTTVQHMENPNRFVPVQSLKEAILSTRGLPDPRGSNALMHYARLIKDGKPYNLEVLYDQTTNTVFHFMYTRDVIGNLPAI